MLHVCNNALFNPIDFSRIIFYLILIFIDHISDFKKAFESFFIVMFLEKLLLKLIEKIMRIICVPISKEIVHL